MGGRGGHHHVEARLPTHNLCIVCATGMAGAPHRWALLACTDCRAMDARIAGLMGLSNTGLPLGRHSIMNRAAIRVTDAHDPAQGVRSRHDDLVAPKSGPSGLDSPAG